MKLGLCNTQVLYTDNWLKNILSIKNKVLIIDHNILLHFSEALNPLLQNSKFYTFEVSEKNKNFVNLTKIIDFFQKENLNRASYIVCIGGGITTDIGAFAASIYMRGCNLILVPTTFLAMIDAAIGGKTAVNFNGIKNNIGSFYLAEKVVIDTDFLNKLSEKEMKNGWAECLKVALIQPERLFPLLESYRSLEIKSIIREAIAIKESIVQSDLNEKGHRRILNLGHTFGHIIESVSNYEVTHGAAVSVGICSAAYISMKLNLLPEGEYQKIVKLFRSFELPTKLNRSLIDMIAKQGKRLLNHDKKKTNFYNFILLRRIGDVFVYSTADADTVFSYFISYLR